MNIFKKKVQQAPVMGTLDLVSDWCRSYVQQYEQQQDQQYKELVELLPAIRMALRETLERGRSGSDAVIDALISNGPFRVEAWTEAPSRGGRLAGPGLTVEKDDDDEWWTASIQDLPWFDGEDHTGAAAKIMEWAAGRFIRVKAGE